MDTAIRQERVHHIKRPTIGFVGCRRVPCTKWMKKLLTGIEFMPRPALVNW